LNLRIIQSNLSHQNIAMKKASMKKSLLKPKNKLKKIKKYSLKIINTIKMNRVSMKVSMRGKIKIREIHLLKPKKFKSLSKLRKIITQ